MVLTRRLGIGGILATCIVACGGSSPSDPGPPPPASTTQGKHAPLALSTGPSKPPGSIRLLPGYSHESLQGIDTKVGRIWKKGGPNIGYDIGGLAGNYALSLTRSGKVLWSEAHVINAHPFRLTMENERRLTLTFDEGTANFTANDVSSKQDLAEVLLMLMTYTPPEH